MPRASKAARRARAASRVGGQSSGKPLRRNWLYITYVAFAVLLVGIMVFFLAVNPASPGPQ